MTHCILTGPNDDAIKYTCIFTCSRLSTEWMLTFYVHPHTMVHALTDTLMTGPVLMIVSVLIVSCE